MRKKFRAVKEISKVVLKHKTFSPKEIRDIILHEYNVERTPESITMFFKRHPKLVEELQSKIGEVDAVHDNIRYEMDYWITKDFKSSIPVIQEWIDTLIARKASETYIRQKVQAIRKICMGTKGFGKNAEVIKDWKIHPLALTEEKAIEFIVEYRRRKYNTHAVRIAVRSFLKYGKGEEPKKISGEKTFGKYGHVYVPKPKIDQILRFLIERNQLIGTYCKGLYKTATRAEALRTAKLSHLNEREKTLTVWDKGKKGSKIKWVKYLDDEMLHDLLPIIEDGKLFQDVDLAEARKLCREAYDKFIPELQAEIPMPLHFWRHMFAQHMLRATGWHYTLVAALGGWKDENTLKLNYGMPPQEAVKQWGLEYVPMI